MDINKIKQVVEESNPDEWRRVQNSYLLTSYKLRIGNHSICIDRWQDAGFDVGTGRFSGITYNMSTSVSRVKDPEINTEWLEFQFKRIHTVFQDRDYEIQRLEREESERSFQESLENYKKQNPNQDSKHSVLDCFKKFFKGIFG